MIFYNIKLIIFSIILVSLTLSYNNDCDGLYKYINYKNMVLWPMNFRCLGELSNGFITNNRHKNSKLREYGNPNEGKYKKDKYPYDKTKTKQNIPHVKEKGKVGTPHLKKYEKENESKSNRPNRSFKNSEMHSQNNSDKSNDKYKCRKKKFLNILLYIGLIITFHFHICCMSCKNKRNIEK
ncbi:stevor PIR protein, putative [Plasmodium sp. gorilla clade G2]|uniref:stevor PIR protein, putative n=1 Tax=Plasmodium sp. gorilla clade G2 TaxID=880535 RepID=UPI000D210CA7|nr:stevor PIR protein, putative [Plasmodium sp. gorilla clade G2]SOV18526.1 stevor PIR protein, putative [Plasmodium sp. gorilla clade G2]